MNEDVAAICGIFCGSCPFYPSECHGCLSNHLTAHCQLCMNGFRECATKHDVKRCNECKDFPCERLEDFKDIHIENGISHHESIIENLRAMNSIGVDKWVQQQEENSTCPKCHDRILWYDQNSHICNKD